MDEKVKKLITAAQTLRENPLVDLYAQAVEAEENSTRLEVEIASLNTLLKKAEIEIADLTEEKEELQLVFDVRKQIIKHSKHSYYVLPGAHQDFKFCPNCWEKDHCLSDLHNFFEDDPDDNRFPLECKCCHSTYLD